MNDLINLSLSAKVVLFGIFPVIIIALGIAYAIKQSRDQTKPDQQKPDDR